MLEETSETELPKCRCIHATDHTGGIGRCTIDTCEHGMTPEQDCVLKSKDGKVWCKTHNPKKEDDWGKQFLDSLERSRNERS